jgi:hypothetical protein
VKDPWGQSFHRTTVIKPIKILQIHDDMFLFVQVQNDLEEKKCIKGTVTLTRMATKWCHRDINNAFVKLSALNKSNSNFKFV